MRITIENIFGSSNVDINTPIIILRNVSTEYLIRVNEIKLDSIVYNVNTDRLHKYLEKTVQFIHRFAPVGQIVAPLNSDKKYPYTVMLANTRFIHVANTFEPIKKNIWVGVVRKNNKISRTLGTIASIGVPDPYPVFPEAFLKLNDGDEYVGDDTYSDKSYGRWELDLYKFNVDKSHFKMIDSTGNISDMYIPKAVVPSDVIDVGYGNDKYKRKVYFTTQGVIVSDSNCVPPNDNMNKMTINECNATSSHVVGVSDEIEANDVLDYNDSADFKVVRKVPYKPDVRMDRLFSKGKQLVLREKDEPWFTDSDVVGSMASITDAYKITGIDLSRDPRTSLHILNGTIDGDENETNKPFISDCKGLTKGHSRYEQAKNCFEAFDSENSDDSEYINRVNNIVLYVMCLLILLIISYRYISK